MSAVGPKLGRALATGEVAAAVGGSSLAGMPDALLSRMLDGAVTREVRAGATIHQGGVPPFFELVTSGLFRAYVLGPDGRTMTVRYCRAGALMGTGTLFNRGTSAQGCVSAVVDSRLLAMSPTRVRDLANREIEVSQALLRETSARVAEYINELRASVMASVRERVARHLLDLAVEQQRDDRLVVLVSQQALASAVGTVREIVVRVLRDMREQGLVRTGRGEITILDPHGLLAQTYQPL